MKLRRKAALIAPAVIIAMTAAACGGDDDAGGGGGGEGVTGGQLVYGFETAFPENLFPLIAAGNSVATAYAEIRVLLGAVPDLPGLHHQAGQRAGGRRADQPDDRRQAGHHLQDQPGRGVERRRPDRRQGLRVQLASCRRAPTRPRAAAPTCISTTGYDQIESVEGADNDKTVTVTLKPFVGLEGPVRQRALFPQHVMDKGDPKANCAAIVKGWPTARRHPGLGGPFLLDKAGIDVNKKIMTLTRNEKYWGEKPKLDRIILQGIGNDPGVSVKALRNNEVQMIYPQPQLDLVKNIKDLEPNITSKTNFGLSFEHIDFNTKDELLGQKVVRQAIALRAEPAGHRGQDRRPVRQPRPGAQQPVLREQPAGVRRTPAAASTTSRTSPRRSRCSRAPGFAEGRGRHLRQGRQAAVLRDDDHPGQPAAGEHDRRDHPAAEAGRHRDQEVPQPGHLRRQGEADAASRAASSRSPCSPG